MAAKNYNKYYHWWRLGNTMLLVRLIFYISLAIVLVPLILCYIIRMCLFVRREVREVSQRKSRLPEVLEFLNKKKEKFSK